MSYEPVSGHDVQQARLEALARKCRLDEEDEARALSIYQGMIDAIAERVARREERSSPPPAVVYVAAYQHRFGVDISAHESRDNAEARLLSIAWNQCMRDPAIRAAVDARFGPLVSEEPPLEPPFEADLECGRACHPAEAMHPSDPSFSEGVGIEVAVGDELGLAATAHSGISSALVAAEKDAYSGPERRDRTGGSDGRSSEENARQERRRTFCEQLLEEWPSFSKGETLWIAECVVEPEDPRSRWHDENAQEDVDVDDSGR